MLPSIIRNPVKKIFENFDFYDRREGTFDFGCPLKISLIAHSIGNFILKNIKTGHFSIQPTGAEIWRHAPILWRHISSNVCFIKKCPILMFFTIKFPIEWDMNKISKFFLKKRFSKFEFSMGGRNQKGLVPFTNSRIWRKQSCYSWKVIKIDQYKFFFWIITSPQFQANG